MPFSDASRYGYLTDGDIDSLRTVFDRLIIERNVQPGCPAYDALAKAIVDIYLSGERDAEEIRRLAMMKFAA